LFSFVYTIRLYLFFILSKHERVSSTTRKIKSILNKGINPVIIKIYENITQEKAKEYEIDIIKHFGRIIDKSGVLTNITPGGDTTVHSLLGANNAHSKIVYQYDLDGNFIKRWDCGCGEIERTLNKNCGLISNCCRGKGTKMAYDYMWFYENKGEKIEPYKRYNKGDFQSKKVYVFDLNNKFIHSYDSVIKAAKSYSVNKNNLSSYITKQIKYKDLYFSYKNDFLVPKQKFYVFENKKFRNIKTLCVECHLTLNQCKHKQKYGIIKTVFL
jgi:hypothetical protein